MRAKMIGDFMIQTVDIFPQFSSYETIESPNNPRHKNISVGKLDQICHWQQGNSQMCIALYVYFCDGNNNKINFSTGGIEYIERIVIDL